MTTRIGCQARCLSARESSNTSGWTDDDYDVEGGSSPISDARKGELVGAVVRWLAGPSSPVVRKQRRYVFAIRQRDGIHLNHTAAFS